MAADVFETSLEKLSGVLNIAGNGDPIFVVATRAYFNCNTFSHDTINLMSHSDGNPANNTPKKGSVRAATSFCCGIKLHSIQPTTLSFWISLIMGPSL
jgi:hypothetical protein